MIAGQAGQDVEDRDWVFPARFRRNEGTETRDEPEFFRLVAVKSEPSVAAEMFGTGCKGHY
ncbi:hypothetical protein AOE01nite_16700 [Acetobacter oeni]|uniref:Uncharacterized protein n=1 Tax=Acetobacter oeni TaxID=304077 RepID=A0A511XKH9_9PROT|nr:hypothetical protein AA21952_3305 [Acetobacter oeni LMG 21952]GEN63446.1 hypothetical protein AOE01nite_16700 [Acetobacter oeni]